MAYDSAREVIVVHGGQTNPSQTGPSLDETWEYDGTTWTLRSTSGPGDRQWAAMVYDSVRRVTVLFGGERYQGGGSPLGDTWTWDGALWTQVATSGPTPRDRMDMAFDTARARVVLHGGHTRGGHHADTWEWDGASWSQVTTSGPGARRNAAMAYDAARGVTVLFGGYDYCCGTLGDTWTWNGAVWTLAASTGPLRRSTRIVSDDRRGRIVLFGGFHQAVPEACCGHALADTWEWDGTSWTDLLLAGPPPLDGHTMAFDGGRGRVVLLTNGASPIVPSDTWELVAPHDNRDPDCSNAFLSETSCWPPNHKFRRVDVLGVSDPDGDPIQITIEGITQDEPVSDNAGSGNTCPDGVLVDVNADGNPETAGLRCERMGKGNGRVYRVRYRATDGQGGACVGSLSFCVPHDQGNGSACSDEGQAFDSMACSPGGGGGGGGVADGGSPVIYTLAEFDALTPDPLFVRGDVNWSDDVDVSDVVMILVATFQSGEVLDCIDTADVNDDGAVDVSDPILAISYLYLGGAEPPEPAVSIGLDPTSDGLSCE